MKYTEELIEKGIKNFKNIIPEDLLAKLYPNSKYTIDFAVFRKKGFAGWPTWIIGLNRNENFEWRKLITISACDDFNKEFFTGHHEEITYKPELFLEQLEKSKNWFQFFDNNPMFFGSEKLDIKECVRLNSILNEYKIEIFNTE